MIKQGVRCNLPVETVSRVFHANIQLEAGAKVTPPEGDSERGICVVDGAAELGGRTPSATASFAK
ncbi:MAG TPA: hypothetical protein VGG28_32950 [Kofleriaceae bacterium]|jgi:redox-sensitive bicupin YhaK (pirin superfamily)